MQVPLQTGWLVTNKFRNQFQGTINNLSHLIVMKMNLKGTLCLKYSKKIEDPMYFSFLLKLHCYNSIMLCQFL